PPLFSPWTGRGPPKSSFFTSLNTMPYTFFNPIWQKGLVGQSGGAPNTNLLATVPPLPLPPDPHAAPVTASATRAAPRAYLRYIRMGSLRSGHGDATPAIRRRNPTRTSRQTAGVQPFSLSRPDDEVRGVRARSRRAKEK